MTIKASTFSRWKWEIRRNFRWSYYFLYSLYFVGAYSLKSMVEEACSLENVREQPQGASKSSKSASDGLSPPISSQGIEDYSIEFSAKLNSSFSFSFQRCSSFSLSLLSFLRSSSSSSKRFFTFFRKTRGNELGRLHGFKIEFPLWYVKTQKHVP